MKQEAGRRKIKIRKGDKVKVIAGKDIGKEGEVEKVLRRENKAVVTGVNLLKKHLKRRGEKEPGGIVSVAAPLHLSNLVLICPKCKKPVRVGYQVKRGERKVRVCRRCREEVDPAKRGR